MPMCYRVVKAYRPNADCVIFRAAASEGIALASNHDGCIEAGKNRVVEPNYLTRLDKVAVWIESLCRVK